MADTKPAEDVEISGSYSLPATTEHDRELALRATQEFDSGNYESCLATITKLAATRGHDLKVTHNQAVAAYYKSGLTKTDEFKRALTELHSKVCICRTSLKNIYVSILITDIICLSTVSVQVFSTTIRLMKVMEFQR